MPRNLADRSHRPLIVSSVVLALGALLIAPIAAAQEAEPESTAEVYRTPPPEMAALVDQPQTPSAMLAPGGETLLLGEVPPTLTIEDLARPELRIGGLRIDPANNGPSRSGYFTSLTVMSMASGAERPVTGLPEEPRFRNVEWSPDGDRIADNNSGTFPIQSERMYHALKGLGASLGIVADGLALLAVGLVVVIFFWKARKLSGRDWHLYRNADGFVARTIARAQGVSWVATLLFLILLEPWDGLSGRLSTEFVLDASLAVMLLSFAGTYFYLDRASDA